MAQDENILVNKLDKFIRKYYKNQLIRGLLYSVGLILFLYLTAIVIEYFGRLSTGARTFIFYSFLGIASFVVARFIVGPLVRLYKLGKTISYEQAAEIIGNHFGDIKDKLLNTLQLKEQFDGSPSHSLVVASIEQRTKELQPIQFNRAIDLKQNRKYIKYAAPPLFVLVVLVFAAPSVLMEGTDRLVRYNEFFEEQSLFQFNIINDKLEAAEQEDFTLEVELSGEAFPTNVYIEIEDALYQLNRENTTSFTYTFKNIQKSQDFRLFAEEYYSKEYTLETLPNPLVLNFTLDLRYPGYLGRSPEVLRNTGDIVIPEGTEVSWQFKTKNTDELNLRFGDNQQQLEPKGQLFTYGKRFRKSTRYTVSTANEFMRSRDSISYKIAVIPDAYPSITMTEKRDSLSAKRMYFRGGVRDDYGFSKLEFSFRKISDDAEVELPPTTIDIPVNTNINQDQYYHIWDMTGMEINAGDQIEYYFEVWDNDGINGKKSTRTPVKVFKAPTLDELNEKADSQNEDIKSELEDAMKDARKLQDELSQLNKDIIEKKQLNWQEKKRLENVLDKQKQLQNKVENIQKKNAIKNVEQNEYRMQSEELLQKQEELQKLFDELMTPEMKELFEELQKMMEDLDKDKIQQKLEEIKLSDKDIEKELDRTLEIFKQMEFNAKMEQIKEKLDQLAEDQEKLSEDTKNKTEDNETLKEKQEELNKEFDDVKKEMEELKEKNEELENKHDINDLEKTEEQVDEEMKESSEQLEQQKNKKASEMQKKASESMQEMAQQMQNMMDSMESEGMEEDMDALRALLENLIELSFNQEDLMETLGRLDSKDPKYVTATQEQKKLKDDAKIIEDSLFALSKRQSQLSSTINREISSINKNMKNTIDYLADRKTGYATAKQQFVMTSLNNLALLLDESLQAMQASCNKSGSGSCSKPGGKGGGKPSVKSMKKMQQALSKELERLKNGQKPGEKPGNKPGQGQMPGMSESLAKLAAEQAKIRQEMEKMAKEMNQDGSGNGNELKKIAKKMEQNEEDIVNKNITLETIRRQKDIMTRLLKSEKAEREREMDNKRESKEANNVIFSNPEEFFEYNRKKEKEVELLNTVPPSLKPYYKNKVNQYFNDFED